MMPRRWLLRVTWLALSTTAWGGCAPTTSSTSEELPSGRQTARETERAVRTARDAGTAGTIYASNLERSAESNVSSREASEPDAAHRETTSAPRSDGTKDASDEGVEPDASARSPSSSSTLRTISLTLQEETWQTETGRSFQTLQSLRRWWTTSSPSGNQSVTLEIRLEGELEPDALGRVISMARRGGASRVEIQFDSSSTASSSEKRPEPASDVSNEGADAK